jgi:hypothetical protein
VIVAVGLLHRIYEFIEVVPTVFGTVFTGQSSVVAARVWHETVTMIGDGRMCEGQRAVIAG